MEPISLLILAGSALVKSEADRAAAKRQEALRRSMEAFQRTKAGEGEAATEQLLREQTPEARAAELARLEGDRARSLRETVEAAAPANMTRVAGNVSPDYERSQEAAANSVAERTKRAIAQLAAMGAPGGQRQKFGLRFGRAAGEVDATNRASAGVGDVYRRGIAGTQPDPMTMLAADAGMAIGAGMMGSGAAGATTSGNANWGSVDAGPGAYTQPVDWRQRLARGLSLFGNR